MSRNAFCLVLLAGLLASGCSSRLVVTEIPNNLGAGSEVDGVPFRMTKRFEAQFYEKQDDGYKLVGTQPISIPDPNRLYVLGFRSDPLSNATVDLVLNPDNTIQQVSLTSVSKAAPALTAFGSQISAATAAETARQTASKTATTGAATAAIAADKAKQLADLAALQYQLLQANPSASAEDLLKAAQKDRSAKLDANEAARLAGRAPYFPDVVP